MPNRRRGYALRSLCSIAFALAPIVAHAQVSTHIAYDEQIKKARAFVALDENMFGDKVSLQDGAVSFSYEDVSVPTNSGLPVAISRKSAENYQAGNTPDFHVFGHQWDLDIPYMMATYDSRDGWNAGDVASGSGWGTPAVGPSPRSRIRHPMAFSRTRGFLVSFQSIKNRTPHCGLLKISLGAQRAGVAS